MVDSLESDFTSIKTTVVFVNVLDQYFSNKDLEVTFKFNDSPFFPQEGDRIAIYKLGWTSVKDYVVFEWAPIGKRQNFYSVHFNKHILPKNNCNFSYQICYISTENAVFGASSSFEFCSEKPSNGFMLTPSSSSRDQSLNSEKTEQEIRHLKEENAMLRESLMAMVAQKNGGNLRNYDNDIKELKEVTDQLKLMLNFQQKEINTLKEKITQGGEEYKKLYLEKIKVERKLEKLKFKTDESKPVAGIINFDVGNLKSIPPFPLFKEE